MMPFLSHPPGRLCEEEEEEEECNSFSFLLAGTILLKCGTYPIFKWGRCALAKYIRAKLEADYHNRG
jgi:hypothetical protein